jgi:hypothetical protein
VPYVVGTQMLLGVTRGALYGISGNSWGDSIRSRACYFLLTELRCSITSGYYLGVRLAVEIEGVEIGKR